MAKIFSTSAAVSAEVASSRIRILGLRASALAISTIWRRDSESSPTGALGWMSSAPTRAGALGDPALLATVDQAGLEGRLGDRDVVGDGEVGQERQLLEHAGHTGGDCRAGRGKR